MRKLRPQVKAHMVKRARQGNRKRVRNAAALGIDAFRYRADEVAPRPASVVRGSARLWGG